MELEYLFSPRKIGNVIIENRIVRSATSENMARRDGQVSDHLVASNWQQKISAGRTLSDSG